MLKLVEFLLIKMDKPWHNYMHCFTTDLTTSRLGCPRAPNQFPSAYFKSYEFVYSISLIFKDPVVLKVLLTQVDTTLFGFGLNRTKV